MNHPEEGAITAPNSRGYDQTDQEIFLFQTIHPGRQTQKSRYTAQQGGPSFSSSRSKSRFQSRP